MKQAEHVYYRNLIRGQHSHDIYEHLGLLHGLALQCKVVVEFGMRTGMSTSAFLAAGCQVLSVDAEPKNCNEARAAFEKDYPYAFEFMGLDSRKAVIPDCDMLFIDSQHDYVVLREELKLHGMKSRKWIAIHDTERFGLSGETEGDPGLKKAIGEFLQSWSGVFSTHLHLTNCNGLTLLKRFGT